MSARFVVASVPRSSYARYDSLRYSAASRAYLKIGGSGVGDLVKLNLG